MDNRRAEVRRVHIAGRRMEDNVDPIDVERDERKSSVRRIDARMDILEARIGGNERFTNRALGAIAIVGFGTGLAALLWNIFGA